MKKLNLHDVTKYVEENIHEFHQRRIEGLKKLRLKTVLKKKNPYLFKAKHYLSAPAIVQSITDAFISSQEETIFGNWLEGLAIFINKKVFNGKKSTTLGIDLEFSKDNIRYIVAIKSGPNWGNSSQIAKMRSDFKAAIRTARTSNSQINIIAVNGCCYGKTSNSNKGDYFKYSGQEFWEFISGDSNLYKKIIEPLGYRSKEKNDEFQEEYSRIINKFTKEFISDFCKRDNTINWEKLVEFNSAK